MKPRRKPFARPRRAKVKTGDQALTSYDTSRQETDSPQKVREASESSSEFARQKKAEGKP